MEPLQTGEEQNKENKLVSKRKKILESNYTRLLIGLIGGALIGLLYWEFIGCNGSCPLTSNPNKTVLFFAAMGVFMSWDKKK